MGRHSTYIGASGREIEIHSDSVTTLATTPEGDEAHIIGKPAAVAEFAMALYDFAMTEPALGTHPMAGWGVATGHITKLSETTD